MEQGNAGSPIHSSFADDPEMLELLELYVAEMPGKVDELESYWSTGDREALERMAHQLKGASAGYGYEEVSDVARGLEQAIRSGDVSDELERVAAEFRALVDVCSRVVI